MDTLDDPNQFINCSVNGLPVNELLISENKLITLASDIGSGVDPRPVARNLFLLKKEIGELYAADVISRSTERQTRPILIVNSAQECRHIQNDILRAENISANDFRIISRDEYHETKASIISKELENPNLRTIPANVLLNFKTWIETDKQAIKPILKIDDAIKYPQEKRRLTLPKTFEDSESAHKRLRGAPGTGKTTLLCHFAINSLLDNRDVLFTCYNVTMINYLHSLLAPYLPHGSGKLTLTHYHNLIRRLCYSAGKGSDYVKIFRDNKDVEYKINDLVAQINQIDSPINFDTIIIDEAQDMQPEWFMQLKSLARNDVKGKFKPLERKSHFLVAYDYGQNIYGTKPWIESHASQYGFLGRATDTGKKDDDGIIQVSYRMPYKIVKLASTFAQINLQSSEDYDLPQAESGNEDCEISFQDLSNIDDVADAIADFMGPELTNLSNETKTVIAVDSKVCGRELHNRLQQKTGKTINHLFREGADDKIAKLNFSPVRRIFEGDTFKFAPTTEVLMSTFHSLKGWETNSLILVCSRINGTRDLPGIYTMFTRIKKGDRSRLLVINMDPNNEYIGKNSKFRVEIANLLTSV